MKAHILHFRAAGPKPPRLLGRFRAWRTRAPFYCANTALPVRAAPPPARIARIVKELRIVNQMLVRMLPARADTAAIRLTGGDRRAVSAFAGKLLDSALREELDRQMRLMARGENVAENQRRKKLLRAYLRAKPPQERHRTFHTAVMHVLREESAAAKPLEDDIVTERRTQVTQVVERRETRTLLQDTARPEEVRRIAEQVLSQVERKLRLKNERSGALR